MSHKIPPTPQTTISLQSIPNPSFGKMRYMPYSPTFINASSLQLGPPQLYVAPLSPTSTSCGSRNIKYGLYMGVGKYGLRYPYDVEVGDNGTT